MVIIKSLQKTSLIDYPDRISATVFLAKCNFRCPFCYNADLVLHYKETPDIREDDVLNYIALKRKWLDGVCITGGEPTLYRDLPEFALKIKHLGLLVKIDTNGSNPNMIRTLIEKGLVDYVAVDIKAPFKKYDSVAGTRADISKIKESIALLMEGKVDYEFRTTMVPSLHSKKDLVEIAKYIKGAKRYFLQQFKPTKSLINKALENEKPFTAEEAEKIRKACNKFVHTELR